MTWYQPRWTRQSQQCLYDISQLATGDCGARCRREEAELKMRDRPRNSRWLRPAQSSLRHSLALDVSAWYSAATEVGSLAPEVDVAGNLGSLVTDTRRLDELPNKSRCRTSVKQRQCPQLDCLTILESSVLIKTSALED